MNSAAMGRDLTSGTGPALPGQPAAVEELRGRMATLTLFEEPAGGTSIPAERDPGGPTGAPDERGVGLCGPEGHERLHDDPPTARCKASFTDMKNEGHERLHDDPPTTSEPPPQDVFDALRKVLASAGGVIPGGVVPGGVPADGAMTPNAPTPNARTGDASDASGLTTEWLSGLLDVLVAGMRALDGDRLEERLTFVGRCEARLPDGTPLTIDEIVEAALEGRRKAIRYTSAAERANGCRRPRLSTARTRPKRQGGDAGGRFATPPRSKERTAVGDPPGP